MIKIAKIDFGLKGALGIKIQHLKMVSNVTKSNAKLNHNYKTS
jgi:hypothetical protein